MAGRLGSQLRRRWRGQEKDPGRLQFQFINPHVARSNPSNTFVNQSHFDKESNYIRVVFGGPLPSGGQCICTVHDSVTPSMSIDRNRHIFF